MILFKLWENYFQVKQDGNISAWGKSSDSTLSVGTWFKCSLEQTERIRAAILAGEAEIKLHLPGGERQYIGENVE